LAVVVWGMVAWPGASGFLVVATDPGFRAVVADLASRFLVGSRRGVEVRFLFVRFLFGPYQTTN
jgi:hypothetical protein